MRMLCSKFRTRKIPTSQEKRFNSATRLQSSTWLQWTKQWRRTQLKRRLILKTRKSLIMLRPKTSITQLQVLTTQAIDSKKTFQILLMCTKQWKLKIIGLRSRAPHSQFHLQSNRLIILRRKELYRIQRPLCQVALIRKLPQAKPIKI